MCYENFIAVTVWFVYFQFFNYCIRIRIQVCIIYVCICICVYKCLHICCLQTTNISEYICIDCCMPHCKNNNNNSNCIYANKNVNCALPSCEHSLANLWGHFECHFMAAKIRLLCTSLQIKYQLNILECVHIAVNY